MNRSHLKIVKSVPGYLRCMQLGSLLLCLDRPKHGIIEETALYFARSFCNKQSICNCFHIPETPVRHKCRQPLGCRDVFRPSIVELRRTHSEPRPGFQAPHRGLGAETIPGPVPALPATAYKVEKRHKKIPKSPGLSASIPGS